jgi:hypothetical protein
MLLERPFFILEINNGVISFREFCIMWWYKEEAFVAGRTLLQLDAIWLLTEMTSAARNSTSK